MQNLPAQAKSPNRTPDEVARLRSTLGSVLFTELPRGRGGLEPDFDQCADSICDHYNTLSGRFMRGAE